jgi:hypothetical protein
VSPSRGGLESLFFQESDSMTRHLPLVTCTDCWSTPFLNAEGMWVCGCRDKTWLEKHTVDGSEQEKLLFARNGLAEIKLRHETYYWSPKSGHLLYLFDDGTWYSDRAPKELVTLNEYMNWYREHIAEEP